MAKQPGILSKREKGPTGGGSPFHIQNIWQTKESIILQETPENGGRISH